MLSVQDTAGALEQVKAIFNPYVEGFAQLVQQQASNKCKLVIWRIVSAYRFMCMGY